MKRFVWLSVGLIFFGLSCASTPSKPATQNDVPNLVGRWAGELYCLIHGNTQAIEIQILNDKLDGTLTGIKSYPFIGKIDQNGKLILTVTSPEQRFDMDLALLYQNDGKIKLKGSFTGNQCHGTLAFEKMRQKAQS